MIDRKRHKRVQFAKAQVRPLAPARSKEKLAETYLPLVSKLAAEVFTNIPLNSQVDYAELCAVGYGSLGRAIQAFNQEKSPDSYGYFKMRIWGSMIDLLRSLDVLSRDDRSKLNWIQERQIVLEQKLGRLATVEEIVEFCHLDSLSRELISGDRATCNAFDSIDAWSDSDDDPNSHELSADSEHPAVLMDRKEQCEILRQALDKLPDFPRKVIALIFYEDLKGVEVAKMFGVTESYISLLRKEGIVALRKAMLSKDHV